MGMPSDTPRAVFDRLWAAYLRRLNLAEYWKVYLSQCYEEVPDDQEVAYENAYQMMRRYILDSGLDAHNRNGWRMPDTIPVDKKPEKKEKPVEPKIVVEEQPEPNQGNPVYDVPSSAFDGRPPVTAKQEIKWVAENLTVLNPSHNDCPNAKAWGLLQFAKDNDRNRALFWTNHYSKLVPSRAEEEAKREKKQDATRLLARISDALEQFEVQDAQATLN